MKRAIFFDGQDVLVDDQNFVEEERVAETAQRFSEIATASGILFGLGVTNPLPYVLRVAAGVAYDDQGFDIRLITGDPDPDRVAPHDVSFSGGDVGKLLTVAYALKTTTSVENPETGAPNDTRQESFQTFHLRSGSPAAHEVVLCTIATIDGSGNATLDFSSAQYWGARLTPQQISDINEAIASSRLHQIRDHVSGVEKVGSSGNPGAITVDTGPTPDEAVITDTVVGDSVLIDGHRLVDANKFSNLRLTFDNTGVGAFPQVWAISVGSTGIVEKQLAAQYASQANIPGVQIADLAPFGVPYPSPLVIEHYMVSATHYLRLNGQSARIASSGLYLLRQDANPDIAVLVNVTAGSLPLTGTIGSPTTDSIVTHPELFQDSTTFEDISPFGKTLLMADGSLLLGFLMWSGSVLNLLGYGTWGSSGSAYDKRNFGNLDDSQISDAFRTRLTRLLSETRADGFVQTPVPPNFSGLTITINANADVVYAYIAGRRVNVPRNVSMTLPANQTSKVFLADNGDGTSIWGHAVGVGVRGITDTNGFVPVWNVTTDGSSVVNIVDVSVTLSEVDRSTSAVKPTVAPWDVIIHNADNKILWYGPVKVVVGFLGTVYVRGYITGAGEIEFTYNAYWTDASAPNGWSKDTTATFARILRFGAVDVGAGGLYIAERTGNTAWSNATGSGGWDRQLASIGDSLVLGQGLLSSALDAAIPRLYVKRTTDGNSVRTEIGRFPSDGEGNVHVYRSRVDSIETVEFAFNCTWGVGGAQSWRISPANEDLTPGLGLPEPALLRINEKCLRFTKMSNAGATPAPATTWADNAWDFGDPLFQIYWGTDTPLSIRNTLSYGNQNKIVASLIFDGSGSVPTIDPACDFGLDPLGFSYPVSDVLRIKFLQAFVVSNGFVVDGTVNSVIGGQMFFGATAANAAIVAPAYISGGSFDHVDILLYGFAASTSGFLKLNSGTSSTNFKGRLSLTIKGAQ